MAFELNGRPLPRFQHGPAPNIRCVPTAVKWLPNQEVPNAVDTECPNKHGILQASSCPNAASIACPAIPVIFCATARVRELRPQRAYRLLGRDIRDAAFLLRSSIR